MKESWFKFRFGYNLLSLVFIATAYSQSGWQVQSSGTRNNLFGVYFLDSRLGYVVGDSGTILHTTNGGINWIYQSSNTINNLREVFFVNSNYGYIVGGSDTVLRTTNGGLLWEKIPTGTLVNYTGISFTDTATGTIVGGLQILRTTNEGNSWISKSVDHDLYLSLANINYIDRVHGVILGTKLFSPTPVCFRTSDAGNNWLISDIMNPEIGLDVTRISMADSSFGVVIGSAGMTGQYGALANGTTDGGESWAIDLDFGDLGYGFFPHSVHCINRLNITIVGGGWGSYKIIQTHNGGKTWTSYPTTQSPNGVFFPDTNNGTVVGNSGLILRISTGTSMHGETPAHYLLYQNYPNPFNSFTNIGFDVVVAGHVSIKVYDLLGRKMATIVDENMQADHYVKCLDGRGLSSGIYLYRMMAGNFVQTGKLLLIR